MSIAVSKTTRKNKRPDPGLQVALRLVEDLIPYARNARTHSDAHVAQIAGSIREFGWTVPVLLDGANGIIAGHGRVLAARKLGLATVPCIEIAHLTDVQRRAYILADNKLALNAGWDEEMLGLELAELQAADFDVSVIGFDEDELAALLAVNTDGLTDPDEVPEAPAEAVSVVGDVWVLGRHRLVVGDSTDADTVARCLNGVAPHLMVTDPPYGVEYDPNWRNDQKVAATLRHPKKGAVGQVKDDDQADWRDVWALFPGDIAYVWHAGTKSHIVAESLIASGFDLRAQVIWGKHRFVIGRGHYHPQHEPCWYAVRKSARTHWQGDRTQSTLWEMPPHQKNETGLSTQKPVECMRRPIENNSSPGQAVYEPFSGSGTTIIAGEMTGRSVHAIEIVPAYVDVAITRWQNFTGQQATLETDGRTFAKIAASRKS